MRAGEGNRNLENVKYRAAQAAEGIMASFVQYVTARSLEEAYALNQKKSAVIVAGNMWLRLCGMKKQTAIDLSALGLDRIEETDTELVLGAMVTLRQLETSAAFGGAFAQAVSPIVGTQFRNTATLGGSVYGRFGFSDVSTLLLALGATVTLYHRGDVPLAQFQQEPWDRDIITHIRIPKGQRAAVRSVRLTATDFPVLVCAASCGSDGLRLSVGSRPMRAMVAAQGLAPDADEGALERIAAALPLGTNLRASEAYRRKIAPVLLRRAVQGCLGREGE